MGFFKKKKKEGEIKAFATGDIIAHKDVKDQMFSAGLMGQGIAIESDDGKFYSPVNGTITMLFPTKHMRSESRATTAMSCCCISASTRSA